MEAILEKMRLPINQRLPSGLMDGGIEIFYHGVEVFALIDGKRMHFAEWPESLYSILEDDMGKHPMAIQSLIELGLEERLQMLWQYARCRFGSFDENPDIDNNGVVAHTEYWDCGFRGECPHEGKLCSTIKVKNGVLSPREIDVIRLAVEDLMAKEIADRLGISPTTVPVHFQNIFRKLGVKRKGDIIRFALQHNIIHNK